MKQLINLGLLQMVEDALGPDGSDDNGLDCKVGKEQPASPLEQLIVHQISYLFVL